MSKSNYRITYTPINTITEEFLIWSLVVSPDGQVIACLGDSPYGGLSTIYAIPTVWYRKRNSKITTYELAGFESESVVSELPSLAFWPDQNHLLVIGRDRQPEEIDYKYEKVLRSWEIGSSNYSFPFLNTLASLDIGIDCFSINESKNLIAIHSDKDLFFLDTPTNKLEKIGNRYNSLSCSRFRPTMLFSPDDKLFAFSPDGHMIIIDLDNNEIIDVFAKAKEIKFPNIAMERYAAGIYDEQWLLAFSPDGLHLVTRDNSGRLFIWNTSPFDIHKNIVAPFDTLKFTSAQYSPDSEVLVTGTNNGSVIFWDTTSYSLIGQQHNIHDGDVHTIKFSSDGNEMFTASGNKIVIWKKNFFWV